MRRPEIKEMVCQADRQGRLRVLGPQKKKSTEPRLQQERSRYIIRAMVDRQWPNSKMPCVQWSIPSQTHHRAQRAHGDTHDGKKRCTNQPTTNQQGQQPQQSSTLQHPTLSKTWEPRWWLRRNRMKQTRPEPKRWETIGGLDFSASSNLVPACAVCGAASGWELDLVMVEARRQSERGSTSRV